MNRYEMIERIGSKYMTANIEGGEYSYVQSAGSKSALEKAVGRPVEHFKLDIRFESGDVVVLVETKQNFVEADEKQATGPRDGQPASAGRPSAAAQGPAGDSAAPHPRHPESAALPPAPGP